MHMANLFCSAKAFINKYPAVLILYWLPHILWYELLVFAADSFNCTVIYSPLDDYIPFVEYLIVPYMLWYFFIAFVTIFMLLTNKNDYFRLTKMLYICLFSSMVISTIFPATHELRPVLPENGNIFIEAVKWLYLIDNPVQPGVIFPSMHVGISILLAAVSFTSKTFKNRIFLKLIILTMALSITASTVLIKQHSIIDVFAGIASAAIIFFSVDKFWRQKE